MKTTAYVLAVLTLTAQMALAQTPADTDATAEPGAVAAGSEIGSARESVVDESQIRSLERDVRPNLQSKLDAQMNFEVETRTETRTVVASVN